MLRRNRDFLALWIGEAVSTLGSQMTLVAFPLLVLATTHSPARAGLVGFANQVPVLALYLPAGVLADRHDRRAIMVWSSAVGAVALASVPVALALGRLPFGQIMVVAFIAGARQVLYSVAEQGALPMVVDPDQLAEAVTGNQARSEAALLAGPPLGGLLYGLARALPFAVDAASYGVAALGAWLVRAPLQEGRPGPRRGARAEIAEGVRWLWRQPFLRASALAVAAGNFTILGIELVVVIRARQHGASPAAVGAMLGLIGLGGLVGALLANRIRRRLAPATIVVGLFWFEAALLAPLVLTRNPYVLGALFGCASLGGAAWNAVVVGARLRLTPDRLRGRVISAARMVSQGVMGLGPLVGGLLAQSAGTTTALLAFVGWQLGLAMLAACLPALRTVPEPGEGDGVVAGSDG